MFGMATSLAVGLYQHKALRSERSYDLGYNLNPRLQGEAGNTKSLPDFEHMGRCFTLDYKLTKKAEEE